MLWTLNCLSVLLLCIFCAGIVIPQILLIAFRRRLFDMPDERKIHQGVVPRLGGIAFKPVVFFSFALVLGINLLLGHTEILEEAERNAKMVEKAAAKAAAEAAAETVVVEEAAAV